MKKVLFIANFNNVMKEVNSSLMEFFQVQACQATESSYRGIATMYEPDAILISLIGFNGTEDGLLYYVNSKNQNIPILTIGTEQESRICSSYYDDTHFIKLLRPISNQDVILNLCKVLDVDMDKEISKKFAANDTRKHILCVDDSGAMLRKMQELIPDDYRVSIVNSGTKAIGMIVKDRPDLIFLDYMMPTIDGKTTLEMIRSEEAVADIPVVFMTGKNDRASIEAVISLKPAGYLLKPPVKEQIMERITSILG